MRRARHRDFRLRGRTARDQAGPQCIRPPLRGRRARESRSTNPWCPDRLQQPSYRASGPRTSTTRKDGDRRHARGSEPRAKRHLSQRKAPRPRIPLEPDPGVRRRRSRLRRARGAFFDLYSQRREVPAWLNLRMSFFGGRLHQLEGINATRRFRPATMREIHSNGGPTTQHRPRLCEQAPSGAPSPLGAG